MTRHAEFERSTTETHITVNLDLEGAGNIVVNTGYGMLDHMLTLIAFWGGMNLNIACTGDLQVDAHHTVEDAGLMFGRALDAALGDRKGIRRVGHGRVPMDEALADVTVDLSGRPWLEWRGDDMLPPLLAGEERDVWREFFKAVCSTVRANVHISFLYGKNGHHMLESAAKGFGMALAQAVGSSGNMVRSTKGSLD